MNRKIFFTILFVKVSIFILIIFAYFLLPFGKSFYYPNFIYPFHQSISLQTAFKTWDAQHYLYLSEHGYHPEIDSDAFSPLFPFTIFLSNFIIHNSFVSGLLLANVFSFIAFYLFFYLVKKKYNEQIAWRSLFALLIFPTSFYFSLIYTESLFFLLVMIFFTAFEKRSLLLASLSAFLLPFTRLIGVAIIMPFVSLFVLDYLRHSLKDQVVDIGKNLLNLKTLFLLAPFLGLFFVMGIFYFSTGSWFTQFTTQQNFISHYSFFSLFNPLFLIRSLFTFPLHLHGFTDSILDRIFFILFIICLFLMRKKISFSYIVYAVCFGMLPVLGGSFMSYMRYLLVVFPLFILFGILSTEKKYNLFVFPFLYFCLILQALFLIMHSLNYWVA